MTTEQQNRIVSAQVVLYENGRLHENAAQECEKYFLEAGFEVGDLYAGSFAITASVAAFEQLFGCHLINDDKGTHVESDTDLIVYELPLAGLNDYLRHYINVLTFTAPPDFGPSDY